MTDGIPIRRWQLRLTITLAIGVVIEVLRIVSGHPSETFSLSFLLVSLLPISWGLYAWLTPDRLPERIVGWIALAGALWFAALGVAWNLMQLRN